MARTTGSDGEKTEAAVREAAVSLIARFGYEAMSMRQLAAEVGVQAAALYRYFPTKEDLLFTLMREHMEGLTEAWDAARPDTADPNTTSSRPLCRASNSAQAPCARVFRVILCPRANACRAVVACSPSCICR